MPRGKPKHGHRHSHNRDLILKNKTKISEMLARQKTGSFIYRALDFGEEMSYPTFLTYLRDISKQRDVVWTALLKARRENQKLRSKLNHTAPKRGTLLNFVGKTPLISLPRMTSVKNLRACIYMKLEGFNPSGSIKDRIVVGMIDEAEKKKLISPRRTILVEPTSGNAGIALGVIAAAKGYHLTIVMPKNASEERRSLLDLLGAHVELTPPEKGMTGAIERARQILKENPDTWMPDQFENPVNPSVHGNTTAQEIDQQLDQQVDIVVAGIGTGGTITGIAQYLKNKNSRTQIIGIEPKESPVLRGGSPQGHGIQGIGAGFVPTTLDLSLVDEVLDIGEQEAILAARLCARLDGVPIGISSGAALYGALQLAKRQQNRHKNIVVIAADGAGRYVSTPLFSGSP